MRDRTAATVPPARVPRRHALTRSSMNEGFGEGRVENCGFWGFRGE